VSINFAFFILGLFGIPIALLAYGHRLRKRGSRGQNAFWGAIIGHCVAGTLAVIIGMLPPEQWTAEETSRGFFGMWSLVLLPAAGALIAALKPAPRHPARP
jgi:hypothetical protein